MDRLCCKVSTKSCSYWTWKESSAKRHAEAVISSNKYQHIQENTKYNDVYDSEEWDSKIPTPGSSFKNGSDEDEDNKSVVDIEESE